VIEIGAGFAILFAMVGIFLVTLRIDKLEERLEACEQRSELKKLEGPK